MTGFMTMQMRYIWVLHILPDIQDQRIQPGYLLRRQEKILQLSKITVEYEILRQTTFLPMIKEQMRKKSLLPTVLYTLDGSPAGIKTVWIFIWIACAIIVISCINYVNLVTGKNVKRNHEVGLKKILGARKPALFFQMMTETVIISLTALGIAIFINILIAGVLNHVSGKDIYFGWNNWNFWALSGIMFFVVTVLAGIYPAVSVSSFKPLNMLHGKLTKKRKNYFLKSLFVVQFIASIVLITTTITMESQLTYIRRINLGYDHEYVFTCQTHDMAGHYQTVKQELMRNPFIRSVTGASDMIFDVTSQNTTSNWEGKTGEGSVKYYRFYVDSSFINDMGLVFKEGVGFRPGDETQYIINETAVKNMELAETIVGKWMIADFGIRGTIVGVVKDFHFNNFYKEIAPLVIFNTPDFAYTLYIRTTAHEAERAITAVEKLWKEFNPNSTFKYRFLDESFELMYRSYIQTGQLFRVFSLITIMISCLGLFGLITHNAEAKRKEIGIRKVLGASVSDIVTLLTKEFLILVGIAMLIAFPLSYFFSEKFLQEFAYRVSIGWWIFMFSGVITIVLVLLTVGWKAVKTATANPVDAIKI